MKGFHEPVLLNEVLRALGIDNKVPLKNKLFIDATLGLGGYSEAILTRGGAVLAIEADSESFEKAKERLAKFIDGACPGSEKKEKPSNQNALHVQSRLCIVNDNFRNISEIAEKFGFSRVDGIVFDLGISSFQIESESRGFSYKFKDASLDMRIDKDGNQVKASSLLNILNKAQLVELFGRVMSYKDSRSLSELVLKKRQRKNFKNIGDFMEVVNELGSKKKNIDPATLPFLGLRIAVNSEIENLKEGLVKSLGLLKKGGRLAVVSFNSTEDRVVKSFLKKVEAESRGRIITKKPVLPSGKEIKNNPRSRSAKMRVLEAV